MTDRTRTEDELRQALRETDVDTTGIDIDSVLLRARRARVVRRTAVGASATLAVLALGFVALPLISGGDAVSSSNESASNTGADAPAPASGSEGDPGGSASIGVAPVDKLNLCAGTLAEVGPSSSGLVVSTSFPDAGIAGDTVQGVVTITNTGSARATGTTSPVPAVTLSENGVVAWHTNGAAIASVVPVDLAPGESLELPASIETVRCAVEDDSGDGFRTGLPPVEPGAYGVSAAISFVSASGDVPAETVTGPVEPITVE